MTDSNLKTKLMLGILAVLLFLVMHFSTNYLAKIRNTKRCLKSRWDDRLPFVPSMVYFYLFTYIFNSVCLFFLIYDKPLKEFIIVVKIIITLIITGSLFYIIMPTRIIKPQLESKNISLRLLKAHNDNILPYNAFPSLHVAFSIITVLVAFHFDSQLKIYYLIILILIAISALLTKQHYIIDIIAGAVLGSIIFIFFLLRYNL
jgi:membrane-associated phospholipid phosphatase